MSLYSDFFKLFVRILLCSTQNILKNVWRRINAFNFMFCFFFKVFEFKNRLSENDDNKRIKSILLAKFQIGFGS